MYGIVLGLLTASAALAQTGPSFDCGNPSGAVEEEICQNEELAALDRELAEVWRRALLRLPNDEIRPARAYQRGWIKGRDECWKESDLPDCVRQSYETRITELQVQAGLVTAPPVASFRCDDGRVLTVSFHRETRLPVAVLTLDGREQVLAYPARSGSGARYEGPNVSYWEHQGEVALTWRAPATTCRSSETTADEARDDVG